MNWENVVMIPTRYLHSNSDSGGLNVTGEGETWGVQRSKRMKGIGNMGMMPKKEVKVLHKHQDCLKFPICAQV